MTDLRKAAEQALEALEANLGKWRAKTPAIEALRQALAQPEWIGLTEVDIHEAMDAEDEFDFARAIEAKVKEKNSV